MKNVTVVYEVIDEAAWSKSNPINYEHDGLRAVGCSVEDAFSRIALLEDVVEAARNEVIGHDGDGDLGCDCELCLSLQKLDEEESP